MAEFMRHLIVEKKKKKPTRSGLVNVGRNQPKKGLARHHAAVMGPTVNTGGIGT